MSSDLEYYKGMPQLFVRDTKGNFDTTSYIDQALKELFDALAFSASNGRGKMEWKNINNKFHTSYNIDLQKIEDKIEAINSYNQHSYEEKILTAKIAECLVDEKYLHTEKLKPEPSSNGQIKATFDLKKYRNDYPDTNISDEHVVEILQKFSVPAYYETNAVSWKLSGEGGVTSSVAVDIQRSKNAIAEFTEKAVPEAVINTMLVNNKYWSKKNGKNLFDKEALKKDFIKQIPENVIENVRMNESSNSYLKDNNVGIFWKNLEMEVEVKTGKNINIATGKGKKRFFELKHSQEKKIISKQMDDGSEIQVKGGFAYNLMTRKEGAEKALLYQLRDYYQATSKDIGNLNLGIRTSRPAEYTSQQEPKPDTWEDTKKVSAPHTAVKLKIRKYANGNKFDEKSPLNEILAGVAKRALHETGVKGTTDIIVNERGAQITLDDKSEDGRNTAYIDIVAHLNNIPGTGKNYLPADLIIKEKDGQIILGFAKKPLDVHVSRLMNYANNTISKHMIKA